MSLQFNENSMTLVHPSNSSMAKEIMYRDILSISEVSDLDVGQKVSGAEDDQFQFGTWKNKEYGQYTLCASQNGIYYIALETTNGMVVFNHGDLATTKELYKAIVELMQEQEINT